jgi:type 1 glutamine amidotransferase
MKLTATVFASVVLSLCTAWAADEKPAASTKSATADASKPKLKVLYITGGGYHKYDVLTPIIVDGIKKHANAQIDVKWNLEGMREKDFGDGYDAIIYNICFAGDRDPPKLPKEADQDLINNALRVTKDGKPTLMLHCTMHTFMASDDWTECCGERTRVHDKYEPFEVRKVDTENPAVKHFPENWKTEGDELYQTINFPQTSTALLRATSPQSGKDHVVCWVHTYGKGQVFGTTLGHDEKTVNQDVYLRLLADGLLWACGKLDADGNPQAGYGPTN